MSGPFRTQLSNPRIVTIPAPAQDYDRVTVTAVAAVNFADLLPVGANSRAATKVTYYLSWLTVTTTTFPAALAAVTGFLQIEFLDNASAVVFGPVNIKAFSATSGNAAGMNQPYIFTPSAAYKTTFTNAGLATAVNARLKANVTAIVGAPSFTVEIADTLDSLNPGPVGAIGGQDAIAQSATNPNAF